MNPIETLTNATEQLKHATANLMDADRALTTTKRDLGQAEAHHTRQGLEGKNEATRAANLMLLTQAEAAKVILAQDARDSEKLLYDLAYLDYRLALESVRYEGAKLLSQPVRGPARTFYFDPPEPEKEQN